MDKSNDILNNKHLKSIELLGKVLDISTIRELKIIELFNDNRIKFDISYGEKPSIFKIRFVLSKNNKRTGF